MSEDFIFHVISTGATVSLAIIGLIIKNKIQEVYIKFMETLNQTKLEIVTGQFRIESKVDQHIVEDRVMHNDFERRMNYVESDIKSKLK